MHPDPARILIADDHPDAAESLAIVLAVEGFEVRTAEDGEVACAVIESWRPRAALIDLDMPLVGGLEVARRVRGQPYGREILLAALTGYGREADREAAREAGFDAHLVKPIEPDAVLAWLAGAKRPPAAAR